MTKLTALPLVSEQPVPSALREGGNGLAFVTQSTNDENYKNDRAKSLHYNCWKQLTTNPMLQTRGRKKIEIGELRSKNNITDE